MKEIELSNGGIALVDDEDYEFFAHWKWNRTESRGKVYAHRCFWVRGEDRRVTYPMHAFLMIGHGGVQIDHIDGNGLNNQKYNLRSASVNQNQYNAKLRSDSSTGFKGVASVRGRFHAQIQANKKHTYLGSFETPVEAALAYDSAARRLHGEFATLNFPAVDERGHTLANAHLWHKEWL